MLRLRHRRAPLFATVAAVALGAALVAACAGLFDTALRLDAPPKRLAGADVVVAGAELGDGAHVRLRVAALLDGSSRHASTILPAALLAAHTTDRLPSTCSSRATACATGSPGRSRTTPS